MLLGSRTATAPSWCGVVPPVVVAFPVGSGGACSARAWWFENWIVDASNRKTCLFSVALSRFRQTPFGVWFEIDRFVIILQCDDLSSGDLAGVIRWPCALFGVWCRR
jgi:hypothetical protein